MFQHYSKRALQVIFATRLKAGMRGADALDVGDLLFAFVSEDQSRMGELMSHLHSGEGTVIGLEAHQSFLSADAASRILLFLENVLPIAGPIPMTIDLPITPDLKSVLEYVEALRSESGHRQIQPLHLLAGIIEKGSGVATEELQALGITHEFVIKALQDQKGKI